MEISPLLKTVDLFGTAAFAVSGAIRVMILRPDIVGMAILASATAIGGGVIRDLLLHRQIVFLANWHYPAVIIAAVLVCFFFPASVARQEKALRYCDAVGLGVFSAFTAAMAFESPGVHWLSGLFLAAIAGCAGGVIRDMIIQHKSLLISNEVYVTTVIAGSAVLIAVRNLGLGANAGLFSAMAVTTGLRICAIVWEWRLPRLLYAETHDSKPR